MSDSNILNHTHCSDIDISYKNFIFKKVLTLSVLNIQKQKAKPYNSTAWAKTVLLLRTEGGLVGNQGLGDISKL